MMYVYKIVLDLTFPQSTWDYRTSHSLTLEEALWIFETFPFEEPAYFEEHPDEGPPPHILFANLKNRSFLTIEYHGNGAYNLVFAKSRGKAREKFQEDKSTISEAIKVFWEESSSSSHLYRRLFPAPGIWERFKKLLSMEKRQNRVLIYDAMQSFLKQFDWNRFPIFSLKR